MILIAYIALPAVPSLVLGYELEQFDHKSIEKLEQQNPSLIFLGNSILDTRIDPKTVSGEYSVVDLRFYDKAGNLIFYNGNDGSLGQFGSYKTTIDNPIHDNQTPQLSDFQMEGSIDAEGRKTITVRTLIDNGASQDTSIKRQYIRIYGPNTGNIDKDNFVLQDDGYYKLTIPLALASADGDYTVSYWFISDRALNDNKLTGDEINSLGFSKTITFN